MTVHCPSCGKPNMVAGLYRGNDLHGRPRGEIPCVHCDRRFSAHAALEAAKAAHEGNGRKVGA